MTPNEPLRLDPVYKDYIWGGERISQRFKRQNTPLPCAESWELSSHPDGMSVVSGGRLEGKSLADLASQYGASLLGSRCNGTDFPLLIKLIDAKASLSVQVHPDDASAAQYGGEAKTEMWYVLAGDANACVYAGLKRSMTPEQFRASIENGTVDDDLARVPVLPGQYIFIPGGTVHAIAEGCLLLEVQQNSNTTYRVYDWGRTDAQGRSRELHIDQAIEVINWNATCLRAQDVTPEWEKDENRCELVMSCEYFTLRRFSLSRPCSLDIDGESFAALFCEAGEAQVTAGGVSVALPLGSSCLVPACATDAVVSASAPGTRVIVTTL